MPASPPGSTTTSRSQQQPPAPAELAPSYAPEVEEPRARERWRESKPFHADPNGPGEPYSIVIPPPNVTAALHLGHALNNTLQDVLIRYHRSRGFQTLWMPGTDHAGIATQTVVEKRVLKEEGRRRTDFVGEQGRAEFVAKIQAWKDQYEDQILQQLIAMGCSCDYDRTRFTMDEVCARAVREAFFRMFKDGLIYRGKRLVNWDPVTQTALADDEVEMEEVEGSFWYLKYPVVERHESTEARRHEGEGEPGRGAPMDSQTGITAAGMSDWVDTGEYVTVATTRPETMLGDTAVAVNPRDTERAAFVGKMIRLPLVNRIIPVIADDYVVMPDPASDDPKAKYATGFLKVTPAHDPNDWEIGQRHGLEAINVLAPDASISDAHGWNDVSSDARMFVGMSRERARERIVEELRARGLLESVKPYTHAVGHSYRSHAAIEPYLSDQWYVGVTKQIPSLADEGPIKGTNVPASSLAGFALRAMARDGITATDEASPEATSKASPKRQRGTPLPPPMAYLLTWTCYGSWLHGDARGSVDLEHNIPLTPVIQHDPSRQDTGRGRLSHPPVMLDQRARAIVCATIAEVCEHRGWDLLAVNVRSNHVHAVVAGAEATPEKVMSDLKAWGSRRLADAKLVERGSKVWTEHGSTRYVKGPPSVAAACRYVLDEQGENVPGTFGGALAGGAAGDDDDSLANASGSLQDASAWEGALRFYPERYARTFQSWHENIRDWCISRQLWWGHRIPVWSKQYGSFESMEAEIDGPINRLLRNRRAYVVGWDEVEPNFDPDVYRVYVCLAEVDSEFEKGLDVFGFTQDPDVLDTWFSSALWPMSTMGWPDPSKFPNEIPEGDALLEKFNPTNVLCTAREIITLWVSRMVMFNIYFLDRLPFRDVFIHAMIQDGEGRKMSKSLGNGVDPRDIIRSKGADAMRFTLVQMTTQTQDVRMPVEYDEALAANTSPKFEQGRRLCNKLWNATRFAIRSLSEEATNGAGSSADDADARNAGGQTAQSTAAVLRPHRLIDRWIISRLASTLESIERALADYQFSEYAQAAYDLFWRDFCDWYLEGVKPTIKSDPTQQAALRATLAAIHRVFQPMTPFITEALHDAIESLPVQPIAGVSVPRSELSATAAWPRIDPELIDPDAEVEFERVRELVSAIRLVRSSQNVHQRRRITLHVGDDATLDLIKRSEGVVEALAGLGRVTRDPAPNAAAGSPGGEAITIVACGVESRLSDLVDAIDIGAERQRLEKRRTELEEQVNNLMKRLGNPSYVDGAPKHVVQQTRDQLARAQAELDGVMQSLEAL